MEKEESNKSRYFYVFYEYQSNERKCAGDFYIECPTGIISIGGAKMHVSKTIGCKPIDVKFTNIFELTKEEYDDYNKFIEENM